MTMNGTKISKLMEVDPKKGPDGLEKRYHETIKILTSWIGDPIRNEEKRDTGSWSAEHVWKGGLSLQCGYRNSGGKTTTHFNLRCSGASLTPPLKGSEYVFISPVLNEETKKDKFLDQIKNGAEIEMHSEAFDNATWIHGDHSVSIVFPSQTMSVAITIGAMKNLSE